MSPYRLLSALLCYPEADLLDALGEVETALAAYPDAEETLQPLMEYLATHDLISLQENYVATFDRNRSHSLHLFEHVYGESRDRGQAMVDLLDTYREHGFEPVVSELPDHVPLFLEFLGVVDPDLAQELLDDAIHVLAAIGSRLARSESPYACIFAVLRAQSRVVPREQTEAPVRDMDEAMETFGAGADGVEPLLRPFSGDGAQTVRFYPRPAH
ncbi:MULTISPECIES: nitrate reductase molybdenum cofactor assembly chaperone [Achromobacter]|uniref:Nitrate reductase molybdenum cofactor assembly chaperone n=1 Tax=Achromobacter denitrificans TaxID=32002 RepID=A0A6N0JKX1_ACHDE|nr:MULTISPECIES: nitrate reductase molybdenum cofactor assembly chaperone [Achromobacter]MDF3849072.1 nitrate reductase molybdenum cofactor assembly chaperone [Achromobacter denitrificans]QKQ47765.1 nitrate reductase molybdenum cofactor assembly chaperone [Achromobacter denitrificans]RSE78885.1 nitrate reductase molybdenum cofactor assembly chaperone [Achromobacter denitrificans]